MQACCLHILLGAPVDGRSNRVEGRLDVTCDLPFSPLLCRDKLLALAPGRLLGPVLWVGDIVDHFYKGTFVCCVLERGVPVQRFTALKRDCLQRAAPIGGDLAWEEIFVLQLNPTPVLEEPAAVGNAAHGGHLVWLKLFVGLGRDFLRVKYV